MGRGREGGGEEGDRGKRRGEWGERKGRKAEEIMRRGRERRRGEKKGREENGERGGRRRESHPPSRIGGMQAAWMGVGLRIAIAPSESTSHRSIPRAGKSGGAGLAATGGIDDGAGVVAAIVVAVGGGGQRAAARNDFSHRLRLCAPWRFCNPQSLHSERKKRRKQREKPGRPTRPPPPPCPDSPPCLFALESRYRGYRVCCIFRGG